MTDYTDNILAVYRRASVAQASAGVTWYPTAERIVAELADWTGLERPTMAAVVAALSPRNPWHWNIQDAAAVAYAATHDGPCPTVTTFGQNRDTAWRIATGGLDWTTTARKVRSFVRNMTGDTNAVTVDVWAVRIATGGQRHAVRNDADYDEIAAAYAEAADIAGCSPRVMQATTWIVAQAAGLGSNRAGRHDKSLKRGTFPLVAALLTGQLALAL